MQNRTQRAKRNLITGVLGQCVSLLLPFITRTYIIYYLGSVYLGLNGLFSSILQVLSLAELGFGEAMVFSLYEPLHEKNVPKVCAILNLYKKVYRIIGTVVLVSGMAVLPFLDYVIKGGGPEGINIELLYVINLLNVVLSYMLFAYKTSLLSATQNLSVNNGIGMAVQLTMSIVQIAILVCFRNYYVYVLMIPLFTVVRNIVTQVISTRMYPEYFCEGVLPKEDIRAIEKNVAALFIYKLCGTMRNSLDSIVISAFCGLVVLAQYQNYFLIVSSIIGVVNIITSSIMAGVGNSIVSESVDKNYEDFSKFLFLYEWIAGWCTVCLFCLYQPFMTVWVGKELLLDFGIVILLSAYFFVLKSGDICTTYRLAAGILWKDKFRPAVEAAANLVLNIILVKNFGIAGVLVATLVTMLAINLIWGAKHLFLVYFKRSVKPYFKSLMQYACVTAFACIATSLLCRKVTIEGIPGLVIIAAICCIVPNVIFLLLYCRKKEFAQGVQLAKRLLGR